MNDPMLIADLVRAGVNAELIARVANALLNVRDNVRDIAVKEYENARKRKWRETVAAQALSAAAQANDGACGEVSSVPKNVPDKCERAPTFLTSLSSSEKMSSEKENKRSENARARGQRMPAGAILTDEFRQAAIELGAPLSATDGMWAEFVDYWCGVPGQRGVKLDWLATWRNDVRRKLEKGMLNGQRKPQRQSGSDRASELAELARSAERARGIG